MGRIFKAEKNMKIIPILLFLFSPQIFSQESRHLLVGGNEVHINGPESDFDPLLGPVPKPDSTTEFVKYKNGSEILRYKQTIDSDGFRISPVSHQQGKTKHALLIGGSQIFGENLNDDQTLGHKINLKSKIYEAYTLGYMGHGPNQAWLRFSQNKLDQSIKQKKGSAILMAHEGDISRFKGDVNHLLYASSHPRIIETQKGVFQYVGSFAESGTLLQKLLSRYCLPFLFCQNFMSKSSSDPTEEDYQLIARLFEDIEKMYRQQFDVEQFKIFWEGQPENLERLKKYTNIGVIQLPPIPRFEDGHPNEAGVDQMIQLLISEKFIK